MMNPMTLLFMAIAVEVMSTSALKASVGFTRLLPSAIAIVGYPMAFYLMAQSMKTIPISLVYAIWSGVGTASIVLIGAIFFRETIDLWRFAGIALIVAGVLILQLMGAPTEA